MEEKKVPNVPRPPMPPRPAMPPRPPMQPPAKPVAETKNKEQLDKGQKQKKEKTKKTKVSLSKKAKTIIALSLVGFFVLVGGVTGLVYYLKQIKQLSTPTNLVINTYGSSIFAECDKVANAETYEFQVNYGTSESIVIPMDIPKAELTSYIKNIGDYQIKVRAIGENPKSASKDAIKTFKNVVKLQAPRIYYDEIKQEISFIPVENTTKYNIYYSSIDNQPKQIIHTTKDDVVYSLNEIFENGAGYYNIKVKALAENDNFTDSEFSNEIVALYKTQLQPVENIEYDKTTKIITFTSPNENFDLTLKVQGVSEQRTIVIRCSQSNQNKIVNLTTKADLLLPNEKLIEISIVAIGTDFELNSLPAVKVLE